MADERVTTRPASSRAVRVVYFAIGGLFFALGVLGAFLPVMPTTPFMLLALAAFARSSTRVHGWLLAHRVFGPRLRAWQRDRVIPTSVKLTAYLSMTASLSVLAFVVKASAGGLAAAACICLVGVAFLSRCPSRAPSGDA